MASNFKLITYQKKDRLHLKLRGDFDGSTAFELVNVLRENGVGFHSIIIDTNDLTSIHSFGRDVFEKNIRRLKNRYLRLIFVGKYRHLFAT